MGAKNNSYGGNKTFLKLKAKTSDTDPRPLFIKQEKQGDEWVTTETFNAVTGELVKIQHTTYEFEKETKSKCIMLFRDPDGTHTQVDANFSGLLYSILNPMCNLKSFGGLEISVWLGKPRDDGKKWPSAGLRQFEEKVEWMYKPEVLPKVKVEEYKGHKIKDDSDVIDFWRLRIEEINERIESCNKNPMAGSPEDRGHTEAGKITQEQIDDDLPF